MFFIKFSNEFSGSLNEGCVTWTTWGSKLETIFSPVFAQLPTIQGFAVFTKTNTPLEISLADAVSGKDMRAWRDVMSFRLRGKYFRTDHSSYL